MRITRRSFLQVGAIPLLGLSLPEYLRADPLKKRSVIFFFLMGGPSHIDTYDPKPEALEEIRGPYETIATNVPGIYFSETISEQAKIANKLTIIRSLSHNDSDHDGAQLLTLTGHVGAANQVYPAFGTVAASLQDSQEKFPLPGVFLGTKDGIEIHTIGNLGFVKSQYKPFLIDKNPALADFSVKDFSLASDVDEKRLGNRLKLLKELDVIKSSLAQALGNFDNYQQQAVETICGEKVVKAFNINEEPAELRNAYGLNDVGQRALLARRLIETGVHFVSIEHQPPEKNNYGWDHHIDLPRWLPLATTPYDQAIATLVADLDQRGLLGEVLVVAFGEFGRTPRLNNFAGRDHWSKAGSAVMAGGGLAGGQVYGGTDRYGAEIKNRPVSPGDLIATIYQTIGLSPQQRMYDSNRRPAFLAEGQPIF